MMKTEFYIAGLPEKYMRFVLEKVLKMNVVCMATAKRNLRGDKVNIFDTEMESKISICKGQRYIVVAGEESDYSKIKRILFPFQPAIYQAEEIFCQTKWKGQPYRFFFKDTSLSN